MQVAGLKAVGVVVPELGVGAAIEGEGADWCGVVVAMCSRRVDAQ
jgi:hypothetical protein